ncbi:PREDICTED: COMM domain-containing protein 1, partial [Buceros rhinoceros silvestris]|uniref:COMM domain-containing protein 1 n=1 Tax=Buceros rhinoceros silvestris TaxID=175836 RepID=UPI00052904A6
MSDNWCHTTPKEIHTDVVIRRIPGEKILYAAVHRQSCSCKMRMGKTPPVKEDVVMVVVYLLKAAHVVVLALLPPKPFWSIASADMDLNQLEAFLTAQTKKQGGITSDQAAVIAKFWKNHRIKIHESMINRSRWDNVLKNMNWRVDLKSQSRHIDQINTPVAIVEMELGKNGQ